MGSGTQNAALLSGGTCFPTLVTCTEEYDGSSWAAGGALITGRCEIAGAGTQNASFSTGGVPTPSNTSEFYNGTSWSAGGALSSGRYRHAAAGTVNAGYIFAGYAPGTSLATSDEYNGTSWSAGVCLNTGRQQLGGAGTANSTLAVGGGIFNGDSNTICTEEYDGSAWSTGGALILKVNNNRAGGPSTISGITAGGTPSQNLTEEYTSGVIRSSFL
jgi:hypothetical protein